MTTTNTSKFRYAVVGTGALGGFYGARLQQAGMELHYLLNRDYEHVKIHGLKVDSPDGNFVLPQVNAYSNAADMPACDVVIVALKTTQNHLLKEILPPIVKPDGVVLVLQNGLGVEAEAARIVGSDRVIGGLCFLCSNKAGPGHINHLDYKKITMGEYTGDNSPGGVSDRLKTIAADFEQAGIPIEMAEDLVLARWKKLMWNIPFNGLSVVLDATTDYIMQDLYARALAIRLMEEVQQGAATQGRHIPDEFLQVMLDHTDAMKPYRTSMKIDYDEKRPLEVEAMYGSPLRTAMSGGVSLPRIEMLYQQLKFLDRHNRQVRAQS
ncbi:MULTISPECIES: putative 2-dehydropantoate 2-reductase [unclassified Leptolyngbya]|uniref:putative 2-dehydropantoate 2-reductase n=1 Tax=unclassified Leptolyngbya TaxID=2650499 RepID=UPI00168818C4|nr:MULTISPECIES: putative 2-dehydropantoate 2-reductase [unclassified Leptolyngbya]MBD1912669.1 putative 2-dehydropantoate 2-reductase [Leptolyngbya sp. FACHB-8]MBD2154708.1 putative 2-dehydropantoate 2-reductase [Leptolyngbya sp. FACHB-16]